jgi:hypothetical protein
VVFYLQRVLEPASLPVSGSFQHGLVWLFFVTQQPSLRIPNLQAVLVDYVMILPQRFGGFDCQFQRLKRLHRMAAVSRHVKRRVQAVALSGFSTQRSVGAVRRQCR